MLNASLAIIRPLVRFGSLFAPGAMGSMAFALFCRTPSAERLAKKQRQTLAAASRRMDNASRQTVTTDHGFVETYRFPAEKTVVRLGTVLLLHGWGGRAAFLTVMVTALNRAGFEVVALDLPGHGASPGRTLTMPMALDAVAAVARVFGPFHGIVGHSFGGAVAVSAATGAVPVYNPVHVQRLALISAPDRLVDYFRMFGRMMGLSSRAQHAMEAKVMTVAGRSIESFDGGLLLQSLTLPTLVIHDVGDKEINHADATRMAAAGPHVRLESVEGLGHRRILQSPTVARKVAAFMAATGADGKEGRDQLLDRADLDCGEPRTAHGP